MPDVLNSLKINFKHKLPSHLNTLLYIYESRNDVDTFEHDYTLINKIENSVIVNLKQLHISYYTVGRGGYST